MAAATDTTAETAAAAVAAPSAGPGPLNVTGPTAATGACSTSGNSTCVSAPVPSTPECSNAPAAEATSAPPDTLQSQGPAGLQGPDTLASTSGAEAQAGPAQHTDSSGPAEGVGDAAVTAGGSDDGAAGGGPPGAAGAEEGGVAVVEAGEGGEEGEEERQRAEAEAAERAEALKKEGNELFGRGAFAEAAAKYNEALETAPESRTAARAVYFANLAACNIKTAQYAAAVQSCTAAVQLDPSYQKAYMRRCEAFEQLDELDHALGDAKKLLELNPDSEWARAKVAKLQPIVDERTEKLKAEMLGKLKDLGNTILGKFGLSTDNFKFDKDPNTGGYSIRFER